MRQHSLTRVHSFTQFTTNIEFNVALTYKLLEFK